MPFLSRNRAMRRTHESHSRLSFLSKNWGIRRARVPSHGSKLSFPSVIQEINRNTNPIYGDEQISLYCPRAKIRTKDTQAQIPSHHHYVILKQEAKKSHKSQGQKGVSPTKSPDMNDSCKSTNPISSPPDGFKLRCKIK